MTDADIAKARAYLKNLQDLLTAEEVANKGLFKKALDFPAQPTFVSPVTIIPSQEFSTGLFNYTLVSATEGGGGDFILNGNFTHGFSFRQADGDATHRYRGKVTAGTILGGASGTEPGYSQTNYGNYHELYGDSRNNNPVVVKGERGAGGLVPRLTGANYVLQDIVAKSTTAASFQANGNVSTSEYYNAIYQQYCRSFGSGQEALRYFGKTSSGGAQIRLIRSTHNFGMDSSRDIGQIEGCDDFLVTNDTGINWGLGGVSGQLNGIQIEYSKGSWLYCIYDSGKTSFTIFANGVTIGHNYFSGTLPGYIGKSDDLTLYYNLAGLNARIDGSDIIIENNYFKNKGVATYAFEIAESKANIIIRNNIFQDYSTAYLDSRGTHTNTITGSIGNNGNVSATIIEPTYIGGYNDPDNYQAQGRLDPSSPYWALRMGYKTPGLYNYLTIP